MKAVVMAGGQGTRLRPLTSNQPKPMLPIVGRPMMEHIIRLARSHGFTDIVATVQFLASVVRNYFGDGSDLGVSLSYVTEQEPLGTAGSVKNAEDQLDDRFLVLSGDALTDVDLTDVLRFHEDKGAAVTVVMKAVEDPLEFGIVITNEDGRIERFLEKPGWGEVFSDTINTGIYVMEREVLDRIPEGEEFDFSKDLFPRLLDEALPMFGYVTDRYWTDVGNLPAYMTAHQAVLDREVEVEISGFELEGGVWLGEGAHLDPDVQLVGPVYLGENVHVEANATLREYTTLGNGVVVKSGAFLHRAVIHDHAYVGATASVRGAVVGRNSDLKFGSRLEDGVVVADECHIGEGAVVNPHVKIYPFKSVDPGAIVSKSIVWQSGGAKSLFGERGVTGLINVDITPEMALRLALAYASMLPKGSALVAGRDATKAARLLKRAMVAGVTAGGLECHDVELVPTPVARFYARTARAMGGFAVRSAAGDPASVEIQFFDGRGIDIDPSVQRRLERSFYRDDLRRAFHHDIGELTFPARGREYYTRGLVEAVDIERIRKRGPKLVLDYGFGGCALTGPAVLGRLGGEVLAVNAVLDPDRVVVADDEADARLESLRRLVRSSGAELGAAIDSPGERIRLVDGRGRLLEEGTALLAMVSLVCRTTGSPRVAVPASVTRMVDHLAAREGGEVIRTRISPAALMRAADGGDVDFAGGERGGYIFPGFLPAFDALMSLMKLLELLASLDTDLATVVDALPPTHVIRRDVPVGWEAKGAVMRRLVERLEGWSVETIDGVKAHRGEDWALVVPHAQEPLVRVWAEASSEEGAEALGGEFAALVEELKA